MVKMDHQGKLYRFSLTNQTHFNIEILDIREERTGSGEMWESSKWKDLNIGLPPKINNTLNDLGGGVHNFHQYL